MDVSDKRISRVACDESQQDWDELRHKPIYAAAFADGARWMRGELTAEIERLRADAARWRCVRDTKGSDLLNTLLCAEPGAECDAVVDRWRGEVSDAPPPALDAPSSQR